MVPTEGPKLTPVPNDINSLTVADTRCLGHQLTPYKFKKSNENKVMSSLRDHF